MDREYPEAFRYTDSAWELFYELVDGPRFETADAELIFDTLKNRSTMVSFGDYLKRFLYEDLGFKGDPGEYSLDYYQKVIEESFKENHTPAAFPNKNGEVNTKFGNATKNWLTRQSVSRETVFLLGFGLRLSVEEVNEFLRKALGEREINPKSPNEVICWYCYMKEYGFFKYQKLLAEYRLLPPSNKPVETGDPGATISRRQTMFGIHDDASLMAYLAGLKDATGAARFSVSAKRKCGQLLAETRRIIADLFNEAEERDNAHQRHEYEDALSRDSRISDEEKRRRIDDLRSAKKHYTPDDIEDSDIQAVFCAAIPRNKQGNLIAEKTSRLKAQFSGKRFSRQTLSRLTEKDAVVDRYDLITLNFFIVSQQEFSDPKRRYSCFVDSTNRILNECLLGELLVQNPYEMFCMLCMLTADPLGTYSDVLELAYEPED